MEKGIAISNLWQFSFWYRSSFVFLVSRFERERERERERELSAVPFYGEDTHRF